MAKVSELISKYVISLFNGSLEGVVENVLFDNTSNKAKYLVVFNETNDLTYLLPTNKIYQIGKDAVSIKNNGCLSLVESKELELSELNNPINSTAFLIEGNLLGVVKDVIMDKQYNIKSLQINDQEIELKNIASFSYKTTLINYDSKVNIKKFYERKKVEDNQQDTRIVNILKIGENNNDINTSFAQTNISIAPNRAITNYAFLINRRVAKNIMSQNGSLIIKQNSRINTDTINIARQNGKLKELTKYSV